MLVAVQGLLDPPLERVIDHPALVDEVVTLELEPTGSCEVVVVDQADQPVSGPLVARLSFDQATNSVRTESSTLNETIQSRTGDNVVFEHVALGRALALEVSRESSNSRLELRSPGPVRPGERIQLRVPIGSDVAILRGRLVDAARAPAAARALRARLEASEGHLDLGQIWSLHTAADGRFSVDIEALSEVPEGLMLALYQFSAHSAQLAVARRALPRELRAASYDLGDFTLVDSPVLAAGRVVDGEGRPIAGASVTPSMPASGAEAEDGLARRESWIQPCRSDAQGRFEIRGEIATRTLLLEAQKRGLIGTPVTVPAGETAAKLVLEAAGTIRGSLLLDPSLPATMLLVHAERDESTRNREVPASVTPSVIEKNGGFVLSGLRAGPYSIHVVFAATGTEVGVVEGLQVRAGETTRDPRIDPLDLRQTCRMIELEIVDDSGAMVRDARAFSRPSGDADARWVFSRREEGRLQFLSVDRPLDIAISARGFLRTELERVSDSRRVTLRRAARLRLEIADSSSVPVPPLFLGVQLTPLQAGHSSGFANTGVNYFDERGVLTCEIEFVGELHVELSLVQRDQPAAPMAYLRAGADQVIFVADHAGEQTFKIIVERTDLETATRVLRGEH